MTCNMGSTDRILRGILGVAIIGVGFYFQSWWGLIGLVFLGTALVGFCPAYAAVGIRTGGKG